MGKNVAIKTDNEEQLESTHEPKSLYHWEALLELGKKKGYQGFRMFEAINHLYTKKIITSEDRKAFLKLIPKQELKNLPKEERKEIDSFVLNTGHQRRFERIQKSINQMTTSVTSNERLYTKNQLTSDFWLKSLELEELQFARKAAREARLLSILAIVIALGSIWVSWDLGTKQLTTPQEIKSLEPIYVKDPKAHELLREIKMDSDSSEK